MKVYVVAWDPDPGYAAVVLLGVFSTRDAAVERAQSEKYDVFVEEMEIDQPVTVTLST